MNDTIYDLIRDENIGLYGTAVNEYGPTLLTELYSEKTHFIYELLQNAEDAYERLGKKESKHPKSVHFELYPNRLEVRHNGIPFDEEDIKGICRLARGTKRQDISQIGKFGIGFKSVYAYTKSPEVYSGDYCFCINNYVHPHLIDQRYDVKSDQTLFIIPFNNDTIDSNESYLEIKSKLTNLGLRTLLFLKNIDEITWKVDGLDGKYYKKSNDESLFSWISLYSESNINIESREKWLKFSKTISIEDRKKSTVQIAYLVQTNKKSKKEHIVPANDTNLVVFFPTEKKTDLNFLIQGDFQTTTSRDNIYKNDWNKLLIKEIAILTAESLSKVKEMDLLDLSFLQTLPLDAETFEDDSTFLPVFQKVKEKLLGEEAFLPSYSGGYITAAKSVLASTQSLRELLSSTQLSILLRHENLQWLDGSITKDKTPLLKTYLVDELSIPEIDPDKFSRDFSVKFIEKQSDDWIKKFYAFLLDQKALWKKSYYSQGPLLFKNIIRLDNDAHVTPFDNNGKPNAYFPSEFRQRFPTIKDEIANDSKAKEFLENLGLLKPDKVAGVFDIILPLYSCNSISSINEKEHLQHIEWISSTIMSPADSERTEELLDALKLTPILYARNICTGDISFRKPSEIYLGELFTGNKDIDIFFEGNPDIWILDDLYSDLDIDITFYYKLGCISKIDNKCRSSSWNGYVTICNVHGWHKRGLDGFDPDFEIEGLQFALNSITVEKAIILWNLLKKNYKNISGIVETSTRKEYSNSTKSEKYSKSGDLLIENSWVPDKDHKFHNTSELMLSDLPKEFETESSDAKALAEKLNFKSGFEQQAEQYLKEKYPEIGEIISEIQSRKFTDGERKKVIEFIRSMDEIKDNSKKSSASEIRNKFEKSLTKGLESSVEDDEKLGWSSISPDEEDSVRENYGGKLSDRFNKTKIQQKKEIIKTSKIIDSIDPKYFLLEQYNGNCQLCNTKLNLGSNKQPYFEIFRLVEAKNTHDWANMEFNVICLCPNCHALMKHHPQRDLTNILEIAEKVLNYEVAPEEVEERMGDYYIVDVVVAGQMKHMYYTPVHMQKISAFIEKTNDESFA
ncbi:sacsin N-terminal ATP-binding-like domain-containing protein [Methanococcoides methylutens]|uniref:Sacsin/Nov domain-containing protein n=1 Tax=Methanococcoides methylutens MM1 TaxID=1434104 RepID=A0A0E3SS95_METMT|nr:ATP-binding protein [Methanococcoides methylutens]AKB85358.1 hypothetical protein MCMEM_1305 [Methanococcoides methylutens MM1]